MLYAHSLRLVVQPYSLNPTIRTVASIESRVSQSLASTSSENLTVEARPVHNKPAGNMTLNTLPYDLLLNIATRLDIQDVHALHLVSVSHVSVGSRVGWQDRLVGSGFYLMAC